MGLGTIRSKVDCIIGMSCSTGDSVGWHALVSMAHCPLFKISATVTMEDIAAHELPHFTVITWSAKCNRACTMNSGIRHTKSHLVQEQKVAPLHAPEGISEECGDTFINTAPCLEICWTEQM
jgi:hypothetical protein